MARDCILAVGVALAITCAIGVANAHDVYVGWTNQNGSDCCHGVDCQPITDDDVRHDGEGLKLRVGNDWCPVQHWHLLKKGKSPNGEQYHACIQKNGAKIGCDRIICFAGEPTI